MRTNERIKAGVLCTALTVSAVAQTVLIPDTNMRAWFNTQAPGCVDANGNLDTTHTGMLAVSDGEIYPYSAAWDLDGLQYMDGLRILRIYTTVNGSISNMPPLPAQLDSLSLEFLDWPSLPPLPAALKKLDLRRCDVTVLPALPAQLQVLWLEDCENITTVPVLPATLRTLALVGEHYLTSFPPLHEGLRSILLKGPPPAGSIPPVASIPSTCEDLQLNHLDWTSLPALPSGISYLHLSWCYNVTDLPTLPDSVRWLGFSFMSDLELPAILPAQCHTLYFHGNSWAAPLPLVPEGLEHLWFYYDEIASIPDLPTDLDLITLTSCPQLLSLPALPDSLKALSMEETGITLLPSLPDGLTDLQVGYTPISALPALPSSLESLALWDLPSLTSIPALPSGLRHLGLLNVPVACLPWLPDGLGSLSCDGTNVNCLPNLPSNPLFGAWIEEQPFTLCNGLNSTCPWLNPLVTGTAYHDDDGDGVHDAGETGWGAGAAVSFQPDGDVVMCGLDGRYAYNLPPGDHTAFIQLNTPYASGVTPSQHPIELPVAASADTLNDFGITLIPNIEDLWVSRTAPMAITGTTQPNWITCTNVGTLSMDGSLTMDFDPMTTLDSASIPPDVFTGSSASWSFTALPPGASLQVMLRLVVDPNAPLGSVLAHTITADPLFNDEQPADNIITVIDTVVGSFDPNDKRVTPTSLTEEQVAAGDRVHYTIRFQNTGTWEAYRVMITDTLSADLQWNTIQVTAASHAHTWHIGHGVLQVIFDNILLPDSATDGPGSHGFVEFSMKPKSDLMIGAAVENRANIYFDLNEPVITAPATFTVVNPQAMSEVRSEGFAIYPNPAQDQVTMVYAAARKGVAVRWLDAAGRIVLVGSIAGRLTTFDVSGIAPGVYTLLDGDGQAVRLVKR